MAQGEKSVGTAKHLMCDTEVFLWFGKKKRENVGASTNDILRQLIGLPPVKKKTGGKVSKKELRKFLDEEIAKKTEILKRLEERTKGATAETLKPVPQPNKYDDEEE